MDAIFRADDGRSVRTGSAVALTSIKSAVIENPAGRSTYILQREQWVPQPLQKVFAFFADAKNLEAITPQWMRFQILTPEPIPMHRGARIDYRLRWHGIPMRWRTEIVHWEPPVRFEDLQLNGPYRLWHHTHRFKAARGGTLLTDDVRYRLPFGAIGKLVHTVAVRRNVEQIFAFRQKKIRELFGGDVPQVGWS